MRYLASVGVGHVAVAVPDLPVLQAFALLDDLPERGQRRLQVADGDDPAAAAVVELVGDQSRGVAVEDGVLAYQALLAVMGPGWGRWLECRQELRCA